MSSLNEVELVNRYILTPFEKDGEYSDLPSRINGGFRIRGIQDPSKEGLSSPKVSNLVDEHDGSPKIGSPKAGSSKTSISSQYSWTSSDAINACKSAPLRKDSSGTSHKQVKRIPDVTTIASNKVGFESFIQGPHRKIGTELYWNSIVVAMITPRGAVMANFVPDIIPHKKVEFVNEHGVLEALKGTVDANRQDLQSSSAYILYGSIDGQQSSLIQGVVDTIMNYLQKDKAVASAKLRPLETFNHLGIHDSQTVVVDGTGSIPAVTLDGKRIDNPSQAEVHSTVPTHASGKFRARGFEDVGRGKISSSKVTTTADKQDSFPKAGSSKSSTSQGNTLPTDLSKTDKSSKPTSSFSDAISACKKTSSHESPKDSPHKHIHTKRVIGVATIVETDKDGYESFTNGPNRAIGSEDLCGEIILAIVSAKGAAVANIPRQNIQETQARMERFHELVRENLHDLAHGAGYIMFPVVNGRPDETTRDQMAAIKTYLENVMYFHLADTQCYHLPTPSGSHMRGVMVDGRLSRPQIRVDGVLHILI